LALLRSGTGRRPCSTHLAGRNRDVMFGIRRVRASCTTGDNMGNTTDRVKGRIQELAGKAKARVGKTIGNEQMQVEGKTKQLTGKAKQEVAKAGERAKGKVEQVAGLARQVEGKLKELKGVARQRAHK
jgi:uncharacterized protein YjbJ (UPF0337 family)